MQLMNWPAMVTSALLLELEQRRHGSSMWLPPILIGFLLLASAALAEAQTIPTGRWTQMTTGFNPSFRAYGSLAWDSHNRWLWYFAGRPGDSAATDTGVNNTSMWAYNPVTNTWTKWWDDGNVVAPPGGGTGYPRRRHSYGHFDYMENRAAILMHGGTSHPDQALTDTWEWSVVTKTWTQKAGTNYGTTRFEAETIYHPGIGRAIAFGGLQSPSSVTPNEYNPVTGSWTAKASSSTICPLTWMNGQMLYDGRRNRIVLFGGTCDYESLPLAKNDMWTYDTSTGAWTLLTVPGTKPAPRHRTSFAYDSVNDRYLVYGGTTTSGYLNDTWVFDPTTKIWTNITSAVGQPANSCAGWGLQYAPEHNLFYLLLGAGTNECYGQNQIHQLYALRLDGVEQSVPDAPAGLEVR